MKQALRSGLLVLLVGTVVTGLLLLIGYRVEHAHASMARMLASPLWRVVLRLHHWGSAGLILLSGFYLFLLLFTGQFRRPNHRFWYAALALLGLVLLFQLTGHALPWDQRAYWTVVIESGIAGNMPIIGDWLMKVIRGGAQVTPTTLWLWYRLHGWVLPALLIAWAVWSLRQGWGTRDWLLLGKGPKPVGLLTVGWLSLWLLAGLLLPIPFGAPADPDSNYSVQPEWYVLSLHASLKWAQAVHPSLEWIGSGLLPGLMVGLLLALPFLVRSHAEQPRSPWLVLGSLIGGLIVLTLALSVAETMAPPFHEPKSAEASVQNPTSVVNVDPQKVELGKQLFRRRKCLRCHLLGSEGYQKGPNLTHIGRKRPDLQWHIEHLKNPKKFKPASTMPSFHYLKPEQLEALAHYLVSLR